MVGPLSKTGSGSWLEARPCLEPRARPQPLTLVVAVDFFTWRGCKPHPNQLGQHWAGTLVSLRVKTLVAQERTEREAKTAETEGD
ncbi:hypothetical protein E2C01_034002 [Portunus trituberculatus]|uniref:Uncharacterized protein n=1 Tax=Portunus trituberculatus TaxID=210409 RepID=A0A5B7F4A8_PORTR|nr:hypothetical protein [Portunus trituberculatus]